MVSRYERGVSSPPATIVNACMHLMHHSDAHLENVSIEQLASRVVKKLEGPAFARLRFVIAQLIDDVTTGTDANKVTIQKANS